MIDTIEKIAAEVAAYQAPPNGQYIQVHPRVMRDWEERLRAIESLRGGGDDSEADELIRALGFDPERFRTEAGFINHYKLRAAIKSPQDYEGLMLHTTPWQWVPIKPEGAPYWGIHTAAGETVAGTSSGLCEGDARLICELHNKRDDTIPELPEGEGLGTGDFYGNGSELPTLHPDPLTNAEILIQSLCARLDTARQALADAAAMQVVQPALQKIKANAAWAMSETAPSRVEPRSAKWNDDGEAPNG